MVCHSTLKTLLPTTSHLKKIKRQDLGNDEAVIPIFLDDTVFPGIPRDIVGIKFVRDQSKELEDQVIDNIVFRLLERLDDV